MKRNDFFPMMSFNQMTWLFDSETKLNVFDASGNILASGLFIMDAWRKFAPHGERYVARVKVVSAALLEITITD